MSSVKDLSFLIIAPEAYPPVTGESIVTTKFILGLLSHEIQLDVIHNPGSAQYYPAEVGMSFNSHNLRLINPFDNHPLLKRSAGVYKSLLWCILAAKTGYNIIRQKKPSLLISRAMPVYGHLPALILSYLSGIPWLANWSDPIPLSISPFPFRKKCRLIDFTKVYCNLVIRRANLHSFPNTFLSTYFKTYYKKLGSKSIIVPHIAHTDYYQNPITNKDHLRMCHVGGLGLRNPSSLLSALKTYLVKKPEHKIELIFIGNIDKEALGAVESLDLKENVSFIPAVPYEESLKQIQSCDVAILIEANTEVGIFLPSKVMDMIQLGKPILSISPINGVMEELLKGNHGGIAVDLNDINQIYNAISELYDSWAEGILLEKYSSIGHREKFNENYVITGLIKELKERIDSFK